jgi:hypothetical protein
MLENHINKVHLDSINVPCPALGEFFWLTLHHDILILYNSQDVSTQQLLLKATTLISLLTSWQIIRICFMLTLKTLPKATALATFSSLKCHPYHANCPHLHPYPWIQVFPAIS